MGRRRAGARASYLLSRRASSRPAMMSGAELYVAVIKLEKYAALAAVPAGCLAGLELRL